MTPEPTKEWFTAKEISALKMGLKEFPKTEFRIREKARREGYQCRAIPAAGCKGKAIQFHISSFPPRVRAAIRVKTGDTKPQKPAENQNQESLWAKYDSAPEAAKNEAKRRMEAVTTVEAMTESGIKTVRAVRLVAADFGVSLQTVYRWRAAVAELDRHDWCPALLPSHNGRTAEDEIPADAWDYFKFDYLRDEKPAASACHRRTCKIYGNALPSARTFLRRIRRELDPTELVYFREGKVALESTYPPQERDHGMFHALEAVNADGHKFDLFVKWPDGSIHRPVVLAFQDIYSRKIISYRIDKTENKDLVRLAFGDMVETYGIPVFAYLDNGRAFASKWISGGTPNRYRFKVRTEDPVGILNAFGVDVRFVPPARGQSKPIERSFLDWCCESVAKHPLCKGAYTGNSPVAKPESYGSRAVDLNVFLKVVADAVAEHNARPGRRSKVCQGRSFDDVFNESYELAPIRKATNEQRRLWMLAAEGVTCSKYDGSVTLDGNRYYCEALSGHLGRKVVARFDPEKLQTCIFVYTIDERFIGRADCIAAAGFADREAARDHNRARNQWLKAKKKAAEAKVRMTAIEAAKLQPDADPPLLPVSKVVKPVFKMAVGSDVMPPDRYLDYFVAGAKKDKQLHARQRECGDD